MTTLELVGLEADNPLHVLAALGALAVSSDLYGEASCALSWAPRGAAFAPRISTPAAEADWCEAVAARLRNAGKVEVAPDAKAVGRRVSELKKAEKKLVAERKALKLALRGEVKKSGLVGPAKAAWERERLAPADAALKTLSAQRNEAEAALAASKGIGPAHLGEIISVPVLVFRTHATRAVGVDPSTARQLAGLASDACVQGDGNVTPTPYSFSNGSSGKLLLKDFRALACACTADLLASSILRGEPERADVTALNWDPRDQRSYALQWRDPAAADAQTDIAANALAYLGLGVVTCFPGPRGLSAVAFRYDDEGRGFVWPVWTSPLTLSIVRSLLAAVAAPGFGKAPDALAARGIAAVFRSGVVNPTGKRNFFGPAMPLTRA